MIVVRFAVALAAVAFVSFGTSASANPGQPTVRTPVAIDTNQLAIRPGRMYFSGDGTFYIGHLRWRRWGGANAVAIGTASISTCEPNCVEGTRLTFPARVRLHQVVRCIGATIYSEATYKLRGELPEGFRQKQTLPLTLTNEYLEPVC